MISDILKPRVSTCKLHSPVILYCLPGTIAASSNNSVSPRRVNQNMNSCSIRYAAEYMRQFCALLETVEYCNCKLQWNTTVRCVSTA